VSAALSALGVQGGLSALGARDGGIGERPRRVSLRLAGSLGRRDLTCGLLACHSECLLASLVGSGQLSGGPRPQFAGLYLGSFGTS